MPRTGARTRGSEKAVLPTYTQMRGGKFTYKDDLGTSAEAIPATNLGGRKGIFVQNLHATADLYLGCCIPEILTGQKTHDLWSKVEIMDGDTKILKWVASGGGANEYYATNVNVGDPGLEEPLIIFGQLSDSSPGSETLLTNGAAGSLNDHEWDWGDNDSLEYDTVYFADATGDPDAATWFVLQSYYWKPDADTRYGIKLPGGNDDWFYFDFDGTVRLLAASSETGTTIGIFEVR